MPSALFRHAAPVMVDYTPAADKTAGDVVLESDVPLIMHRDFELTDTNSPFYGLSSAAIQGGVYLMTKAAGVAYTVNEACYWNASTGITKTQSDYSIGRCAYAAASGDLTVLVLHDPIVGAIEES